MSDILNVSLPFPDFQAGEIIDPEQFDENNAILVSKINEVVELLNTVSTNVDDVNSRGLVDALSALTAVVDTKIGKSETYSKQEIDERISVGDTIVKMEAFTIVAVDSVGKLFSYQDKNGTYTGQITDTGGFRFQLRQGNYAMGANRIKAIIDDTLLRSATTGGLVETSPTGVVLTDALSPGMEVTFEYFQRISIKNDYNLIIGDTAPLDATTNLLWGKRTGGSNVQLRPIGTGNYDEVIHPETNTEQVIDLATGSNISQKITSYDSHINDATKHNIFADAVSTDGETYSITLEGVTDLVGVAFTVKPNMTNTNHVKLVVNGSAPTYLAYSAVGLVHPGFFHNEGIYTIVFNGTFFVLPGSFGINNDLTSNAKNFAASSYAVSILRDKVDSSPITLSTTSPLVTEYSGALRAFKINHFGALYCDVKVTATTLTANVGYTVTTLPTGYRPGIRSFGYLFNNTSNVAYPVSINTNGVVTITPAATVAQNTVITGSIFYIIG